MSLYQGVVADRATSWPCFLATMKTGSLRNCQTEIRAWYIVDQCWPDRLAQVPADFVGRYTRPSPGLSFFVVFDIVIDCTAPKRVAAPKPAPQPAPAPAAAPLPQRPEGEREPGEESKRRSADLGDGPEGAVRPAPAPEKDGLGMAPSSGVCLAIACSHVCAQHRLSIQSLLLPLCLLSLRKRLFRSRLLLSHQLCRFSPFPRWHPLVPLLRAFVG